MIAFLPIARYKVDFQVASGRPFSSFERLLLKAVQSGSGNLAKLAQVFAVHRRLVIEGLVTLMQAGWVSLGERDNEFILTRSGEKAYDAGGLPPTIAVSDRHLTVVVEKVTGQVARSNEIEFHTRANLKSLWEEGAPLFKGEVSNIVDPALVAPLLLHQPTEWIRWIGPISVVSDNAAFALIDVDTTSERISGVPRGWETLLLQGCLDQVLKRERDIRASGVRLDDRELRQLAGKDLVQSEPKLEPSDIEWSMVAIREDDVLSTPDQHKAALRQLLFDADSYACIACPSLAEAATGDLIPLLAEVLSRGVVVNLLLGAVPEKLDARSWSALESLRKLEYDSTRSPGPGRLALGTRATQCATSIALADSSAGVCAILGAYAWTAPPLSESDVSLSVRFRDSNVVARVCEIVAGFVAADQRLKLDAGFMRLKKAAADCRQHAGSNSVASEEGSVYGVRLLLDKDHAWAVQLALTDASAAVSVLTEDLMALSRGGWLRLLERPTERLGAAVHVVFGSLDAVDLGSVPNLEVLVKNGARVHRQDSVHGTLLTVDDSHAIITNLSSATPSARQVYSSRIGVAVNGAGVVSRLLLGKGEEKADSLRGGPDAIS